MEQLFHITDKYYLVVVYFMAAPVPQNAQLFFLENKMHTSIQAPIAPPPSTAPLHQDSTFFTLHPGHRHRLSGDKWPPATCRRDKRYTTSIRDINFTRFKSTKHMIYYIPFTVYIAYHIQHIIYIL